MLMSVQQRWLVSVVSCAAAVGFLSVLWLQSPARIPVPLPALPSPRSTHAWDSPRRLLPYAYWQHRATHPELYPQMSCSFVPRPDQLQYAAAAWQRLRTHNRTNVYIYGAYWDDRFEEPVVRVLVYCDVTPPPQIVCLLWYEEENAPDKVPATAQYGWRPEWGGPTDRVNEPYILACAARRHPPARQRPPAALSLVLEGYLCGTPTNILNVQGIPPLAAPNDSLARPTIEPALTSPGAGSKLTVPAAAGTSPVSSCNMSFCVCLKWLQFEDDVAASLVEWIEFIKEFGAGKLFAFMVQVHPNVERVLAYYAGLGFAEVTAFTHAPQLRSNFPTASQDFHDYRRELLPLNDCLYRALAAGCTWLVAIDSDEIIVPQNNYSTWREVVEEATRGGSRVDALVCLNYYFIDAAQKELAAPPYMRILGHRYRAQDPSPPGHNVKSFHNTSSVVAMHNHLPMSCDGGWCDWRDVNESVARLHHYREQCGDGRSDCSAVRHTVRDDTLARYSHVAVRVRRVLRRLALRVPAGP